MLLDQTLVQIPLSYSTCARHAQKPDCPRDLSTKYHSGLEFSVTCLCLALARTRVPLAIMCRTRVPLAIICRTTRTAAHLFSGKLGFPPVMQCILCFHGVRHNFQQPFLRGEHMNLGSARPRALIPSFCARVSSLVWAVYGAGKVLCVSS